jgi:hypothetical protein
MVVDWSLEREAGPEPLVGEHCWRQDFEFYT